MLVLTLHDEKLSSSGKPHFFFTVRGASSGGMVMWTPTFDAAVGTTPLEWTQIIC